jgi:hypothetical protein
LEEDQEPAVKVFISAQIRRKEFGRKVPAEDLPVISRSARAALGVTIAARGLPPHTQLIKAYATSKRGPKRIVYLLAVEDGDMFLLFYRGKNDAIGKNASMSNSAFRAALEKYLALLEADISGGNIEELLPDQAPGAE